jgi:hypothetical protein
VKRPETLLRRAREEGPPLLPAGVTIAVALAWAATGGGYESRPVLGAGYDPDRWYLGALVLVGLLCATGLGLVRVRLSRWAAVACAALVVYTVWSFLSVLWAHDQGAAFLGSDRALVYTATFVTFAILPWSNWSARVALTAFVAGLGALALVTAVRLAVLANPSSLYLNARLVYPLGYYNADAALFTTAGLTAVALSSRRCGPALLRIGGLAIAAVCLQLAVLGQSRGWLFTAPVVLALALLIVPGRLRLLAFALGPVAATVAVAPALLRVYGRVTTGGVALPEPLLGQALHRQGVHAVRAMLIADAVLAVVATVAVIFDKRVALTERAKRRADRLGAALAVVAVLAGVAAGLLATHGHVVGRVERAWHSFANSTETTGGSSRFTTLGSQRVDFWRVGLREWSRHPLLGVGQDNFAAPYLRLRHTEQEPRWVHSLELRLLVHTGLLGALLFGLFIVAVLIAALRGRGRRHPERVAAGIALLPFVVWFVHGSIDWFWEFPALSVPALAFAGAATALRCAPGSAVAPGAKRSVRGGSRRLAAVRWVVVALLGAAALAALAIPFAAAREAQKAIAVWPDRPALAYRELRSASSLMPFDAQIDLVGGAIGLNLAEPATARHWFEEAARRNSQEWLASFVLGLLESERGRSAQARAQLLRARALNPREPVVGEALARVDGAHPLTFAQAQLILSARGRARFGR